MRSLKWMESEISEPPKPRLRVGVPGKSSAKVFHIRMLELPMNNTPPGLGGFALSLSSNLAMADSQRSGPCFFASAAPAPDKQASVAAKASGVIDFVKIPFNSVLRIRSEKLSRPASGCKEFHRPRPANVD